MDLEQKNKCILQALLVPVFQLAQELKFQDPNILDRLKDLMSLLNIDNEAKDINAIIYRIKFVLWSTSLTEEQIGQFLPEIEQDSVSEALEKLVENGEIVFCQDKKTYTMSKRKIRLAGKSFIKRIGGLRNFLRTVKNNIKSRFLSESDSKDSFSRTVTLKIRGKDIPKLQEVLYKKMIWKYLVELDKLGEKCPNSVSVDISIFWGAAE